MILVYYHDPSILLSPYACELHHWLLLIDFMDLFTRGARWRTAVMTLKTASLATQRLHLLQRRTPPTYCNHLYIYIITIIRCYYNDWYINCNPIIISSNDNRMVELYYPNIIILVSYCPILILSSFNGLVEGKIYRKTSIFPIN
jgi:hypothetical protein